MFKVQKIDGRFKAHSLYQYQAKPVGYYWRQMHPQTADVLLLKFIKARNWCTEQWGTGHEIEVCLGVHRFTNDIVNPHWAYEIEYAPGNLETKFRIYLASEVEASYFAMVWATDDNSGNQ